MIQWIAGSVVNYIIAFMMKKLKGNLFINAMTTALAHILGQLTGNYFIKKFKIRPTFKLMYSLTIFITFLILYV